MSRKRATHLFLFLVVLLLALLVPALALAQDGDDEFTKAINKGPLFMAGAAFIGGLGVNLTPCVYPLIVITTSVFGAKQAKNRLQAAALSSAYVLGITLLYTTVLVVTGLVHGAFGALMAKPSVNIVLALIFTALAASMFGAFDIALPESVMQRLSGVGGVGYRGAVALGLVSGLIAAPCSGPVTIGMITWIGTKGNASLGAIMGLAFSLGLGLPTWFVGTFAAGLPKGGRWMVWIKSFFGCVMLGVALFYLKNAVPKLTSLSRNETWFVVAAIELCVLGLAIGAVHVNWDDGGLPTKVRKALGIVATVAGGFLAVTSISKPKEKTVEELKAEIKDLEAHGTSDDGSRPVGAPALPRRLPEESDWATDFDTAKAEAMKESRPMIVDFGAEWCPACKELEKQTFPDEKVRQAAGKFVGVHIDCTDEDVLAVAQKKYGVKGLPTVLLINSKGEEKKRFTKFLEPGEFVEELQGID